MSKIFNNRNNFSCNSAVETVLLYGRINESILSICIPTYKRPSLLKEAIISCLEQNYQEIKYQVIVVDNDNDFTNNENLDMIRKLSNDKIVYYKNKENLGMYGNINRSIELASSKWIALLHDDDMIKVNYLEQMSLFIKSDKYHLIIPRYNHIFSNQKITHTKSVNILCKIINKMFSINICKKPFNFVSLFLNNYYEAPTCGVLLKKQSFIESGGFNPHLYPTSDWFFFIYFTNHYKSILYKKYIATYRWEDNASLKKEVLNKFKQHRKEIYHSLKEFDFFSNIIFFLFSKDINKVIDSDFNTKTQDLSLLYRSLILLLKKIYY